MLTIIASFIVGVIVGFLGAFFVARNNRDKYAKSIEAYDRYTKGEFNYGKELNKPCDCHKQKDELK